MENNHKVNMDAAIQSAVNSYLEVHHIRGRVRMHASGVQLSLHKDTPDPKMHDSAIAKLVDGVIMQYSVENNLEIGCQCGECPPSFSLREYISMAIKTGIESTSPEIDSEGKLDQTKQIGEATDRVFHVLTRSKII